MPPPCFSGILSIRTSEYSIWLPLALSPRRPPPAGLASSSRQAGRRASFYHIHCFNSDPFPFTNFILYALLLASSFAIRVTLTGPFQLLVPMGFRLSKRNTTCCNSYWTLVYRLRRMAKIAFTNVLTGRGTLFSEPAGFQPHMT